MTHIELVLEYFCVLHKREGDHRMQDIVAYVESMRYPMLLEMSPEEQVRVRSRVRQQMLRIMDALSDTKSVIKRPSSHKRGGYTTYRWIE